MKIEQTIHIGNFTINSIGGSSIVQIGSAGLIQAHSESYETKQEVKAPPKAPGIEEAAAPEIPGEPFVKVEIPEISLGMEPSPLQ